MKIEINLEKRYFLMIVGFVLIIGAGIFVYAATAPNPGHTGSQINVDCPGGQNNQPLEACLATLGGSGGGLSGDWIMADSREQNCPSEYSLEGGVFLRNGLTYWRGDGYPGQSNQLDWNGNCHHAVWNIDGYTGCADYVLCQAN